MTPRFQVVEAKPNHCGQMARLLRVEHHRAVIQAGFDAHRELRSSFDESSYRKAWLIDGRLAGLGGVRAPAISSLGFVWLALTDEALRYPIEIVKESRRQLDEVMLVRRELATTLLDGDESARRFAVFLGFHPAGDSSAARAYSKLGRRMILRYMDSCESSRIPVGASSAIVVSYHAEAA